MRRPFVVGVYGAGGYTGRLVLAELQRRGVRAAALGRPSEGLTRAAAEFGCEKVEVELSDRARLVQHFAQTQVVLMCAGPFAETATAVLDAALEARTHLLDLSGEPEHLMQTLARHDAFAQRELAVVHSVGFDVIPAELLASLCQRPLGALASLELATAHTAPIPSRGTLRSYLATVHGSQPGGLAVIDGALVAEPLGRHRAVGVFTAPVGPRACASTGSAEVVLLARSIPTRHLRHALATLAPAALAVADQHLPTASEVGLKRALDHLEAQGTRGPDATTRANSHFALWCEAKAVTGQTRTMTMQGIDPYGLSARLAVDCAVRATDASFHAKGVLTPLQTFDRQPLLATMAQTGVRWSVVPPPL